MVTAVGCVWWMKSAIIFLVLLCLFVVFFHLHLLFTFSALISIIYWCGIVSHQQILMVRHVAPAEIIGAANAAPAAPVSTPMVLEPNNSKLECFKLNPTVY